MKDLFHNLNRYSKKSEKIFLQKKDFYKSMSKSVLSKSIIGGVFITSAVMAPSFAHAAENVSVGVGEYYRINAKGSVTRVAVGNPEVADVTLLPGTNREFLVVGKKSGTTSLLVWRGNVVDEYRVSVGFGDSGLSQAIEEAIGLPKVRARVINQNNKMRILLEGSVRDQIEHDRAVKIASLYTGDKTSTQEKHGSDDRGFEYNTDYKTSRTYENVVDLLTIESPTQIRIEAQIIEVSNSADDSYGITYGSLGGISQTELKTGSYEIGLDGSEREVKEYSNSVTMGTDGVFYAGQNFSNSHKTGFWFLDHFADVNARINALMKKGKAKILSRPNISTMSGSKAKIQIGGQIPYAKSGSSGNDTSVEWKEYGIRLNIDPTVSENNDVTAEIHAEVSVPDWDNAITSNNVKMPAIRSRNVHSLVNIEEGKTMVIGGLLSSEDSKVVNKVPLLSSIPIIGEFFKHTTDANERRELIILLTPRVVNQDTPTQMGEKLKEWYAQNEYDANKREKVDVNNPPLPKKIEEKQAKEEEEKKQKEAEEYKEKPGTHIYERWQKETNVSDGSDDYAKFRNVDTP